MVHSFIPPLDIIVFSVRDSNLLPLLGDVSIDREHAQDVPGVH